MRLDFHKYFSILEILQVSKLNDTTFFSDHEVEVFTRFTTSFEAAVKNMLKTAADQTQKCQNHYKREFQTIGKAFLQLGQAMEQDNNHGKIYKISQ